LSSSIAYKVWDSGFENGFNRDQLRKLRKTLHAGIIDDRSRAHPPFPSPH
jgi:hypothetical protein